MKCPFLKKTYNNSVVGYGQNTFPARIVSIEEFQDCIEKECVMYRYNECMMCGVNNIELLSRDIMTKLP